MTRINHIPLQAIEFNYNLNAFNGDTSMKYSPAFSSDSVKLTFSV